jgi:hypothetical protein
VRALQLLRFQAASLAIETRADRRTHRSDEEVEGTSVPL